MTNNLGRKACTAALALALGIGSMGLVACGSTTTSSTGSDAATEATAADASGDVLAAPTDFTIGEDGASFSFTSNDENIGYYFVRVYKLDENGNESGEYATSSKRLNNTATGEITGTLDTSSLGWGSYDYKLVSFAASGTDYESPESVIRVVTFGEGGTLERPEMAVVTSGNTVQFVLDWYTLSDWYDYQYMPTVTFNVYSDAECTNLVTSEEFDTSTLEAEAGMQSGQYGWGTAGTYAFAMVAGMDGTESGYALTPEVTLDSLEAGTYYVTATASCDVEGINDSQASEAVDFTVTADAAGDEFESVTTSLWQNPSVMGPKTVAAAGTYTDRTDFAQSQTVGVVVSD